MIATCIRTPFSESADVYVFYSSDTGLFEPDRQSPASNFSVETSGMKW